MTITVSTRRSWTTALVAVAGLAAWMTLCDRFFHVSTTTVVHFWQPLIGEQTVWVIPLFGLAAVTIVSTAPRFAAAHSNGTRLAAELLVMTTIYAISGFVGASHPTAVAIAFTGLFAARIAASHDRRVLLVVALLLAVSGPLFESLQWQLGMFRYTQPDVIGVPWWLFPFYANGAWALRALGALLARN